MAQSALTLDTGFFEPIAGGEGQSTESVGPAKRAILVAAPLLLLASTYGVFNLAAAALGFKLGYFAGFAFYWVFWCFLFPLWVVGWSGLKRMFADRRPRLGRPAWVGAVCLALPLVFAYAYEFPRVLPQASLPVILASVGISLVNGLGEEVLWRGTYALAFPGQDGGPGCAGRSGAGRIGADWIGGYLVPAVGFAVWHFAPQSLSANTNPGGAISLVVFALFLGLVWGWVAKKTRSIRFTALAHVLFDFSGLGGRFYFG